MGKIFNKACSYLLLATGLIGVCDYFQIDKIDKIKKDLVINKNVPIENVEKLETSYNPFTNLKTFDKLDRVADSAKIALANPTYSPAKISSIMTKLYH